MKDAIVVQNLSKRFRRYHPDRPWTLQEAVLGGLRRLRPVEQFWGLRDVSFTVPVGKVVGVVGINGSGKSTLLRLVGGVGRPDSGTVTVNGRIGALLDLGAGFHPDLTGRENVFVAGVVAGLTRRDVVRRFASIVEFAEVENFIDHPLRTYSTGMQMRLAFAVAIHVDPEILLIDEVLSVGDLGFQRKCLDRIGEFKARGCSILLVSHEASLIREFCDKALWLSGGRLVMQGQAGLVVDHYVEEITAGARQTGEGSNDLGPLPDVPSLPAGQNQQIPKLAVGENRFGSLELKITAVRLLDSKGRPFDEFRSGDPLRVEIDYLAARRILAPIFQVYIFQDDLVCCDLNTEGTELKAAQVEGAGRVSLCLERFDLKQGRYFVDVGCYAQNWVYAYDYHSSLYPLLVRGEGVETHQNAPHHWEISAGLGTGEAVTEFQHAGGAEYGRE
jgi:lipopolysaccharide transport system ATP-binding protein